MRFENGTATRNVFLSALIGALSLAAIAYLSITVTGELRLLNSARSDNVQWTLSQSEVEFLEFDSHLASMMTENDPDLDLLRREFDIFYSRVTTLSQSDLYANLRMRPDFSQNLARAQIFLESIVPQIDASDAELRAALPALRTQTTQTRAAVRALSNSGLSYFATASDERRQAVSTTLTKLAVAVGLLMMILVLLAIYLGFLNAQNVRRRTEITQASERMKIVTGTSLDAVIVSDDQGRILDFNAAAETIFGHNAEDVIGADLGALIVPDHHRAGHAAGMERMRRSGEKRVVGKGRVKLEAKRADGDIFPVELAIQSAETQDGEIFIAFLRDISHRVKAEQDLVAARDIAVASEKAKTDFLATMSHEIRTPLNGLLGNLTLLQDTELSTQQSQYIKNMNTSGRLLMSHISDVLDITKYDAGKLRLRPVPLNLSELMQDIVDSQSGAAIAQNSVVEWGWKGTPANWVNADRERIQHILVNLIGNAVKFTRDGRIVIELEMKPNAAGKQEIHIGVQDTGIGIDADLKPRIFDDFVTGDPSYDREVGGTGLGLGIARRFVQALGGQIGMESEKGVGSYFWVRFPVEIIAEPALAPSASPKTDGSQSGNILVVEDNEINRLVAREMLKKVGYTVKEAHNGRAGVEMANAENFDLILMDISMPVMDGRTATRMIRSGHGPSANTPIIALTANAMAEEQEAFLSDGMNAILTKPLSREALTQTIDTWVTEPETTAMDQPDSHLDELHELVGTDTFHRLLDQFLDEMDDLVLWLETAGASDLQDVQKRAHKGAGSAATFGALELRAALQGVETAASENDAQHVSQACKTLAAAWTEAQEHLTSVRSR